jgi:hypothetical protein
MSHHTWEATYAVKCLREAKRMENLGILGITLFSVRIPIEGSIGILLGILGITLFSVRIP